MDLQEKMEQAQKRREGILAETRKEAQEDSGKPAETPAPSSSSSSSSGNGSGGSWSFDKISKGFSMKVDGAPAVSDDAKPKEEAPKEKPSFSFGGFGGGGAQSDTQEKKTKPAVPEPPAPPTPQASEPKPSAGAKGEEPNLLGKLNFSEPKKEESKPQQAAPAPPPPPPAPKPEPAPAPQLPKQELPKPSSTKKYESEVKGNADGKRNERNKNDQKKKKKSNGFKLFGSQMLMLGAFVGGTYALLFKGDLLNGWMEKADAAILSATSKE